MADSESNYLKGFITGALIGGLAGGITALLLAPKSGKELRQDIAEKSSEVYEKASDLFVNMESSVGSTLLNTVNDGRMKAENIISNAKQKAGEIMEKADEVMQEAKNKANSLKDNVGTKLENLKDAAKAGADAFKAELNSERT